MKKLIIIIIYFFIFKTFGQNGLKEGNYFLLLNNKEIISLNLYENYKINEIKIFEITEKSIYTTDQKRRVAIIDTAKNTIYIYDFQSSKEIKFSIPFSLKSKTILLNDENLFIGGEFEKEMLVQYHFESNKWFQLEIPTYFRMPRKSIDDMVINDSLLIAIDDFLIPKYVLFYRLNSTERLEFLNYKKLEPNGTYETIHQGRITQKYFGLISSTVGSGENSKHITIYDKLNLTRSFSITTSLREKNFYIFNDFLIVGDKIIIATNGKGLGILEINKMDFERVGIYSNNDLKIRIKTSKVKFNKFKKENIIKLTIIPNSLKIVLTIEDSKGKIRHEIIEI